MKTKLFALAMLVTTIGVVALYPAIVNSALPVGGGDIGGDPALVDPAVEPIIPAETPKVEVVFVLDTTSSMSGLIDTAKEKIWSIATNMANAQPAPEIRMGLVAYRDRGDEYVTRVHDLSEDLDSMYATLMDFAAQGGGDTPESVNAGLAAAIDRISWSRNSDAYQVVFLVGDSPPKVYQNEEQYPALIARATTRNLIVNTIRCGESSATEKVWQQIASLSQGRYFSVDQGGGSIAMTTPFDARLAELSAKLDETRVFYGDAKAKAAAGKKLAATAKLHDEASDASRARRAIFNAMESGIDNLFGDDDLVEDVASGDVALNEVAPSALPEPMQAMSAPEREGFVRDKAEQRKNIRAQIAEIAAKRDEYVSEQSRELEEDALKSSLDYQLFDAVKAQGERKGLRYRADAPKL